MKHWWVPGLQIGYEHTFVHQVADFLEGLATASPPRPTFRDGAGDPARLRRRPEVREIPPVGERGKGLNYRPLLHQQAQKETHYVRQKNLDARRGIQRGI